MTSIKGMRAVVTGASSGIGEEYARQLAVLGADLVIVARRKERLEKLASELSQKHGVKVETLELDLGAPGAGKRLFEGTTAGGKDVQILVNNAGIGPFAPFLQRPLEKHHETLQLNVTALTDACYLFAGHMVKHGKPSYISNVASIAAFVNTPNFAVYSGTKSYVRFFSEVLHFELAATNVRVSCLCPGGTYTEFLAIAGQELKASGRVGMMSSARCARIGISGMLKGKVVVVPGLLNKFLVVLPRLLPRSVAVPVTGFFMNQSVKMAEAPRA